MSESKKLFFLPTSIYPKATKKLWFHRQISFLVFSTLPTVQRRDDHNVVDHHVEMIIMLSQLNSLYSGESGQVSVNAMNAPNNSTLQVQNTSLLSGCWHIDENRVPKNSTLQVFLLCICNFYSKLLLSKIFSPINATTPPFRFSLFASALQILQLLSIFYFLKAYLLYRRCSAPSLKCSTMNNLYTIVNHSI